jgi:hypothetical protein
LFVVRNRPTIHLSKLGLPVVNPGSKRRIECGFGIIRSLDSFNFLVASENRSELSGSD